MKTRGSQAVAVREVRIRAAVAGGKFRGPAAEVPALEQEARRQGSEASFAEALASFAMDLVSVGDLAGAERLADRAAALTGGADVPWPVPAIYYSAGRTAKASPIQALLAKRFSRDAEFQTFWGPVTAATAALARGDHAAAIETLRPVQAAARARPAAVLLRGRALFGAGRIEEAAAAFQFAIDHRFIFEPSPLGTVSRIWLARARAKLGDAAAARRHYQDAFAAWKDADPDVPILVEARKEYAALRQEPPERR